MHTCNDKVTGVIDLCNKIVKFNVKCLHGSPSLLIKV